MQFGSHRVQRGCPAGRAGASGREASGAAGLTNDQTSKKINNFRIKNKIQKESGKMKREPELSRQ